MKKRKRSMLRSFGCAAEGIVTGIREERNMKIHCAAAVLVAVAGAFAGLTRMEWCVCLILCGMVLALELVNTALEAVTDLVTEEWRPLAKKAKDLAAGAVLIGAVTAAAAGCVIFIPHFL